MSATQEQLEYLDDLRKSGITNMYGARPYLQNEFGMPPKEASVVLKEWMSTFSERHKNQASTMYEENCKP